MAYFLKLAGVGAHDQVYHEPGGVLALVVFWGHGGGDGGSWPWSEVKCLLKPWGMRAAVSGGDVEGKEKERPEGSRLYKRQTILKERAYRLTMLGVSIAFFACPLLDIQFVA